MHVRPEEPADEEAIRALVTSAFLEAEHSGGNEAAIVDMLRNANSLTVSLVATDDKGLIGHVAFSPVLIDDFHDGWFGLGPVAVIPGRQRQGIGSGLIATGLARLREKHAKGCVVLGDPDYYGRFGFAADPNLRLAGVPPEYFQCLSFNGEPSRGEVTYHPAFGAG